MKDHTGGKRKFFQLSRAWYGDTCLQDIDKTEIITIGFYQDDGSTTGEFQVSWEPLGGKSTPRLCAFDDSWHALYCFRDLLEKMAFVDGQDIPPAAFRMMLITLGIEDATPENSPYGAS